MPLKKVSAQMKTSFDRGSSNLSSNSSFGNYSFKKAMQASIEQDEKEVSSPNPVMK
jgi:multimeric flavodoxin WrbA